MICTHVFLLVKAHLRPSPCDVFGYITLWLEGFGGCGVCFSVERSRRAAKREKEKGAAVYCEVNFVVHN